MKSKKLGLSLMALAATCAGMVGCKATGTSSSNNDVTSSTTNDLSEKVELTMSVYYDNNDRHMKFIEGAAATLPYSSCDGNSYKAGDFKPVWKAIQKNLNIKIDDVSPTGKVSIKDNFSTLVTTSFKSNDKEVNIAQGNSDQILSEGTTKNTILDLSAYLDSMPNFKKFLEDNPVVKKTISASDGKIYYAPYFDGYDDLERMMMLRQDWVEKLLDGDLPADLDSTAVSSSYTPFYTTDINFDVDVLNSADENATGKTTIKKNVPAAKNIIKQMNGTANLTGATAVKLLRDYIDEVYGTTYGTKRSELFCGGRAVYDVDELVALFRCVKANSKFLTGKDDVSIVPLFPRAKTSDRTTDLYRFLQFFGVRGVESRNEWMYVDRATGKLVDTRGTTEFATGLEKLHEMYSEGLIMKDFTDTQINGKDDYRGPFYTCADDSKTIGFATYDYNQTTTIYNDTTKDSAMKLVSILPATADWDDGIDGNFIHYTESWRSVKTQGWFITQQTAKDSKKLARALKLFDYLYSDEGNRLMSYGPDEYLEKNADGTIKTMDYQGKQVPVLSTNCKNELKTLASGNYTNYYRYYLGGTLPVGYIKEQGMEYQAVSTKAQPSLNVLNKAIQYGVLQHVNHQTNTNHFYDIVPTTLPFTQAENTNLGANFTALKTVFTSDKSKVMSISKIVMGGWGTYDTYDFSSKEKYLSTVNSTLKLNDFVNIYNDGYNTFKKL